MIQVKVSFCFLRATSLGAVFIISACAGQTTGNLQNFVQGSPSELTPHITRISPLGGPLSGGTSLTVLGNGFSPELSEVFIGGVSCRVTERSEWRIVCTSGRQERPGFYSVEVRNGSIRSELFYSFVYEANIGPRVHRISPTFGPLSGGTRVTIHGAGFSVGATVTLGGSPCVITDPVAEVTPTSIQCLAPERAIPGAAAVIVANLDGQSSPISTYFNYQVVRLPRPTLEAVNPGSGPLRGGTRITLSGANFVRDAVVSIAGTQCPIESQTSNQIICLTPESWNPGEAEISIRNPDRQINLENAVFIYEEAAPAAPSSPINRIAPVFLDGLISPPPSPFRGTSFPSRPLGSSPSTRFEPGVYRGSEAEALGVHFQIRRTNGGTWLDSVQLGGSVISIGSSDIPQQTVRTYTIHNRDDGVTLIGRITAEASSGSVRFAQNETSQDILMDETNLRLLSTDLQTDLLSVFDGSVEIGSGGVHPDYVERHNSTETQAQINRIRQRIDHRIEELNASQADGYFLNPMHMATQEQGTNRDIYVHDNAYDGRIMTNVLEAIRLNNEENFVQNSVDFATSYPLENIQAKRSFIDAFSTLYVTKHFPSEGIRQNFYHFLLRCGHLY